MTIEPLTSLRFFEAFYSIYKNAISPREQKTRAEIENMCFSPEYIILLLAKENTTVTGFSIIFVAEDNSFCLLEYMAIAENCRNQGKGQELFIESYHWVAIKHPLIPMLIEIDSDSENAEDQILRTRRRQFYQQLGCRCISHLDYQLAIGQPPQMALLIYQPEPLNQLLKSELANWLQVIYHRVYQTYSQDIRIEQMLKNIPDPVEFD